MTKFLVIAAVLAGATLASADDKAAFEQMKSLAGAWSGKGIDSGQSMPTTIRFRVVSNGSAIEETDDPGGPYEMITMYYLDAGTLKLTHYCAMGNQPRMRHVAGSGGSVKFAFDGGANCKPGGSYMDSAEFKFLGKDHVTATWTMTSGGKEASRVTFDLNRKAAEK